MVSARKIAGSGDKRQPLDFYPTPAWATEALLDRVTFNGLLWEPASGNGAMSKVLERKYEVFSSDIREDGYGQGCQDFMLSNPPPNLSAIVTNPPYNQAQAFIERAKLLANDKIAMLLRLLFLETSGRYHLFQDTAFPLAWVYVFSRRVQMSPEGDAAGSPMMAFAWFVWDKAHKGPAQIGWIP